MNNLIQQITDLLIDRLPEDDQYYRLGDLKEFGYPVFVIHRIKVELERNLAESIVPPQTDWANMQSENVQAAWNHFLDAIRAEVRLPASYAQPVIETAVAEIMEMLVQPRKNIPEVIYGSADELDYEELKARVESVVVYRHFASVLPRYMEKKGLDTLPKKRCKKVVSETDEKLTDNYSPLNWAQMLEPLFNLLDEQIDTSLLRLFFEDRNMPRIARHFDLMDDRVNRAELIEILSSPELLDFEGYEEPQPDLFNEGKGKAESEDFDSEPHPEPETGPETAPEGEPGEPEVSPDMAEEFHRKKAEKTEEPEDEEEESLNTAFHAPGEEEEFSDEETAEAEDGESSLNVRFAEENADRKEADSGLVEPGEAEGSTGETAEDRDEEESPMWQRFMDPDELSELEEREEPEMDDEGFVEEPIIDLTKDDSPDEEEVETLQELLDDDRERFVEEIFRGSEQAYEDAIRDIAARDEWRSVSRYIENEIFKRNLVDMYSEAAVDFTDRLQSYFLEKSKS